MTYTNSLGMRLATKEGDTRTFDAFFDLPGKMLLRPYLYKEGKFVYDYSNVIYFGGRRPVAIKCKIHGIFREGMRTHLSSKRSKGCDKYNDTTKSIKGTG